MASANLSGAPANLPGDERVRNVGAVRKLLARPEFGAIAGTVLVVVIFLLSAGDSGMFSAEGTVNWGTVAAFLGIIAVGAALLMIAGEFDLSVGSMIGFAGMMVAIPILEWGWAPSMAVVFAFACAMALGWLNGWLVIKTGLPSFIVTLAFFFILRGLSLAVAVLLTGKTILSTSGDVVLQEAMLADPVVSALFHGHVLTGLFDSLAAAGWMAAARDDGTAPGHRCAPRWWCGGSC